LIAIIKGGDYVTVQLSALTWPETKELVQKNAVVIIPTSAFEQHGYHLTLDTDMKLVNSVSEQACRLAQQSGVPVVMTPAIWTGFSPHHMRFAGSITLSLQTFHLVVKEVCESLWSHGFRKLLLLNGHGGNSALLRSVVQELRFSNQIRAVTASYWDFAIPEIKEWRLSGPGGIDHACEMETALMLYLDEDQVRKQYIKEANWFPKSKYLTGDLAIAGMVSTAFDLAEITDEGVAGDPSLATKERGEQLFALITQKVSGFLEEFHTWSWEHPKNI
jgi:creatinine amidohydrolase